MPLVPVPPQSLVTELGRPEKNEIKYGENLTNNPPFLLKNIQQKCNYGMVPPTCLLGKALMQRVWYFRLDSLRCCT